MNQYTHIADVSSPNLEKKSQCLNLGIYNKEADGSYTTAVHAHKQTLQVGNRSPAQV